MHRFVRHTSVLALISSMTLGSLPVVAAPPAKPGAVKAEAAKPKTLSERLPPDARKHFESAILLYEDQNWEGAFTEFQAAYDLSKEPRVLRNVAVCQKNLKRYADAILTLQRSIVEGADFEADLAQQINDEIDILMPLTALVTLEVDQPGAEVTVDGRPLGPAPFSAPIRMNVGERTIVARKPGFVDATSKVKVTSSAKVDVKLTMEPLLKVGKLSVAAKDMPANVKVHVSVDGVDHGEAPLEMEVPAGKHTVELSAPGYVSKKVTRDVEYKGNVVVDMTLEKEKHEGVLAIETGVPEATIKIDDKVVGTGSYRGTITSGGHQITVNADGYKPYSSDVTVLDGQQRIVSVSLEKNSKTWLWLTGGGLLLAGAGIGGYFLFRPKDESPTAGTIPPGVVTVPLFR